MKVNELLDEDGIILKVVESDNCIGCVFISKKPFRDYSSCGKPNHLECEAKRRADNKNVKFVEV
jgi:hypothetical protein